MLTITDEMKDDRAKIDAMIADAEAIRERKKKSLAMLEAHIDGLYVQRMRLEGQIERVEAPLVKPQGHCVTINGWDV